MSLYDLPEELLHLVAGHLAYTRHVTEHELPEFHYKHATEEIRSFSLLSRRLRRISLPFLFAFVQIKYFSGLTSFRERCLANPVFAESIKIIHISSIQADFEGSIMLRQLLPHLRRLLWIHFETFKTDDALLIALHAQETVRTIAIDSTHYLTPSDASKVLLHRGGTCHPREIPRWRSYLSYGMQVAQLAVTQPHLLHEDFAFRRFNGLRELDLIMNREPVTLFWLAEFTSAHPQLQKIRFQDKFKVYFRRKHPLPFISDFLDRLRQEDSLSDEFDITRVVISRPERSSEQWHVTGLKIVTQNSLKLTLHIINSSFPKLSLLSLEFEGKVKYHIDDFVEMVRTFSSLKILGLHKAFNHLHNGCDKPWAQKHAQAMVANQAKKTPSAIMVEAGMLWYTNQIAQTSSVEAFFVHEENMAGWEVWTATGWYTVQNTPRGGSRCVVGKLGHKKRFRRDWEIY